MRAARLGAVLLCALVVACSEEPPRPPPPPPVAVKKPLARLTLAQGKVEIARDGQPPRSAEIEDLFDQDLIITGDGARAILKFKSGGELELAQNSRFRLTASAANVDVDLKTGIISLLEGEGATLITQYGRTKLAGGTGARLARDGDGLTLDLLAGEISQIDEDGGTVTVKAGQKLKFQVGAVSVIEDAVEPGAEVAPLPIAWYSLQGAPELKPRGEKKFKPVKDQPAVAEGTAFKVPANARARLETEGLKAQVAGGSSGTVESAGKTGKGRELKVSLGGGQIDLQLTGDGPSELVIPSGGVVVRVKGTQRAQVRVQSLPNGARVTVLTGEVGVSSGDGAPTRVGAGEVATVDKAKVQVAGAKKPPMVLPMGKAVRAFVAAGQEVALDLPEELSEVQVASDPEFKELLLSGKAKGFLSVLDPAGEVYWRTLDAQGQPDKTGHAVFKREKQESRDKPPEDAVPEQTEPVTFRFQSNVPPDVTFTWQPTEGANLYHLRVYPKGSTTAAVDTKVNATKYLVPSGRLKEGKYTWLATPLSASSVELPRALGGKMAVLDLAFDNSVTVFTLMAPTANEHATAATRARGVAPIGSRLTLNGAAVALDEEWRFDLQVGKTSPLVFRCTSKDGREDYLVRTTR